MKAVAVENAAAAEIGTRTCPHDEFDSNLNSILDVLQGVMGELEISEKAFAVSSPLRVKEELDIERGESLHSAPSTLVMPIQHFSATGLDNETSAENAFSITEATKDQTVAYPYDNEVLREMDWLKLRLNQREDEISMLKDDKIIRLQQCHSAAAAAEAARTAQKKLLDENAQLHKQVEELCNSKQLIADAAAAAAADGRRKHINSQRETPNLQQRLKCTENERNRLWADVQHLHEVSTRQRHEVDASQRSAREAQVAHNDLKLRLVRLEDETISLRQKLETSGGQQRNNRNAVRYLKEGSQDGVAEMVVHMDKLEKETFSLRRRVVVADKKYFSEKTRNMELESRVVELQEELTQKSSAVKRAMQKASLLESEGENLRKEICELKNVSEMDNTCRLSSLEVALEEEKAHSASLALQLHSLGVRSCPPPSATRGTTPQPSNVASECSSTFNSLSTPDDVVSILNQLEVQKAASSRLAALAEEETFRRRRAEKRLSKLRKSAEMETAELQRKLNAVQSDVVKVEEELYDTEGERRLQDDETTQSLKQNNEVAKMASKGGRSCVELEIAKEDLRVKEQVLEKTKALLQKLMLKLDSKEVSSEVKVQSIRQELSEANVQLELNEANHHNPSENDIFIRASLTNDDRSVDSVAETRDLKEKAKALEQEMVCLRNEAALLRNKLAHAEMMAVSQMGSKDEVVETQQTLNELLKCNKQLEEELVDLKVEEKTLRIRLEESSQREICAEGARALAIEQMDALRESLVAETQWSSAQEKDMERLYSEFNSLKEGITAPMTIQENRIADLQNANIVLIRGLESAKEEAEVLRQELSNSMGMKEESMNTLLMDLEASRKSAVQYETKVAELQTNFEAKCEELNTLKTKGNGIQRAHDLYASRETELISQVERLQQDLNAEVNKHRLTRELKENLDQTVLVLKSEIQSLKERLQRKFITEQNIGDTVSKRITIYPPIFTPYLEDDGNSNSYGEDLMKLHAPQKEHDDDGGMQPESLPSSEKLVESEGLVVQTWRKGFRQALNEMDRF